MVKIFTGLSSEPWSEANFIFVFTIHLIRTQCSHLRVALRCRGCGCPWRGRGCLRGRSRRGVDVACSRNHQCRQWSTSPRLEPSWRMVEVEPSLGSHPVAITTSMEVAQWQVQ